MLLVSGPGFSRAAKHQNEGLVLHARTALAALTFLGATPSNRTSHFCSCLSS